MPLLLCPQRGLLKTLVRTWLPTQWELPAQVVGLGVPTLIPQRLPLLTTLCLLEETLAVPLAPPYWGRPRPQEMGRGTWWALRACPKSSWSTVSVPSRHCETSRGCFSAVGRLSPSSRGPLEELVREAHQHKRPLLLSSLPPPLLGG